MKRYLATFFRGKWVYVPALILMCAASVVGAWLLARPSYDATAHLWADRSALAKALNPDGPATFPAPPDPADQQAKVLNQLLQSDAFVGGIIESSPAARQSAPNQEAMRDTIADVRSRLKVEVLGPNSLAVAYTSTDPLLAEQVVQSTINQFVAWSSEQQREQEESARQYYQRQLTIYEMQLNEINQSIAETQRNYLAVNPGANPNAAAPQIVELERLQRERETAQARYVDVKTKLDVLNAPAGSAGGGQSNQIRVIDRPTSQPQPQLARILNALVYVLLGVGAGMAAILAAVGFATWRDDSIRTLDELAALTDAPVLETIPEIRSGWRSASYPADRPATNRLPERSRVRHLGGEAS